MITLTTLTTIPARHHATLAAARVDVKRGGWSGPLVALDDEGIVIAGGRGLHAVTRARFDEVTIPATAHNSRALAVVLAEACGLDVSSDPDGCGVTADLCPLDSGLTLRNALGRRRTFRPADHDEDDDHVVVVPALATIPTTAPDALFRALCAALCALETA